MKSRTLAFALVVVGTIVLGSACAVDAGPAGGTVLVTCSDDNVACNVDVDCCSYYCASDGFCGAPLVACTLDNDPCATDHECCSDICAPDGYCGIP